MTYRLNLRKALPLCVAILAWAPALFAQSDTSTIATPYNDLAIPTIMGTVVTATGSIGMALFVVFFLAEAFRLNFQAALPGFRPKGGALPNFSAFLWRSAAIVVSLTFLYRWTFLKLVTLCDAMYMGLGDVNGWANLVSALSAGDPGISLTHLSCMQLIYAASAAVLTFLDPFVFTFRWVLLAMLYAVGPICWAFAVSEIGLSAINGWFRFTWQVSFWVVLYGIIKTAVVPLANYALQAAAPVQTTTALGAAAAGAGAVVANVGTITSTSVVIMLTLLILLIEIPQITAILFSNANVGAISKAFMTLAQTAALGVIGGKDSLNSKASPISQHLRTAGAAIQSIGSKASDAWTSIKSRLSGGSSASDGASNSSERTR